MRTIGRAIVDRLALAVAGAYALTVGPSVLAADSPADAVTTLLTLTAWMLP